MKHLLILFFVSLCFITRAQKVEPPKYIVVENTLYQRLDTGIVSQIIIMEKEDNYDVFLIRFKPIPDAEIEVIIKEFFKPEPRKI